MKSPISSTPAECVNCAFYQDISYDGRCAKHDFVMPRLDWRTLCNEYLGDHEMPVPQDALEKRTLYYYAQHNNQWRYTALKTFERLKRLIISVSVRYDEELGWIIYPRKHHQYFPAPLVDVQVTWDKTDHTFQTINVERSLAREISIRNGESYSEFKHVQQLFMLFSPQEPEILRAWIEQHFEVNSLIKKMLALPRQINVVAFLEVVDEGRYNLIPDYLLYPKGNGEA